MIGITYLAVHKANRS